MDGISILRAGFCFRDSECHYRGLIKMRFNTKRQAVKWLQRSITAEAAANGIQVYLKIKEMKSAREPGELQQKCDYLAAELPPTQMFQSAFAMAVADFQLQVPSSMRSQQAASAFSPSAIAAWPGEKNDFLHSIGCLKG
jgi:hypothetical protein